MITLIASVVGFLGSIIPEVIKIVKLHKEQNYQLSVLDKQIELKKTESEFSSTKSVEHSIAENCETANHIKPMYDAMDTFNSTVRPVIAYGFFIIYLLIKYAQYMSLEIHNITACSMEVLWMEDDKAAFASIISFYFGQRMFKNKK